LRKTNNRNDSALFAAISVGAFSPQTGGDIRNCALQLDVELVTKTRCNFAASLKIFFVINR
jgi:hypothetical protein